MKSEFIGNPHSIRHFIVSYQQFDYGLVNDIKKLKDEVHFLQRA